MCENGWTLFQKNMKRLDRRGRTQRKRNQRLKRFSETKMFSYGRKTIKARKDFIKQDQQILLETPCNCSCSQCSHKNSWNKKSDTFRMRDDAKKMVDNFFRMEYNVSIDD